MQEKSGEEDCKGAGDKFEVSGYSGGRVLVEEVRSEADQGVAVSTVSEGDTWIHLHPLILGLGCVTDVDF